MNKSQFDCDSEQNSVIIILIMKTKAMKEIMPLYVGLNSGPVITLNFCVSGGMF